MSHLCLPLWDPTFPTTDWLWKVYTQSLNLTMHEGSYNVYLSCVMSTVEIAFGRLNSLILKKVTSTTISHLILCIAQFLHVEGG